MKFVLSSCLLFLFFSVHAERIKLSTIRIEVPDIVAEGNKTTILREGVSTYSLTRLRADSASYSYHYSFKYQKALFEFRETCKADIWEELENSYKPKRARKKEFKNFRIENFENLENGLLDIKLQKFQIEYTDGLRKLTLIYKIDETTQFMASVKSPFTPSNFLAAQNTLVSILESATQTIPKIGDGSTIEQKGEISDKIQHYIVNLPFALSNDFDNPVVAVTIDDEIIVAFAHASGSEVMILDKNFKLKSNFHYDKLIHDVVATENGFFAVSSDDYNLLRYNIDPSLYLTKHKKNGELIFIQNFFKKDNAKIAGNESFDYYSRDGVCLEIVDSIGIVYCTSEKRISTANVVKKGAYRTFSVQTGFLEKGGKDLSHAHRFFSQKSVRHEDDVFLYSIRDAPKGLSMSKLNLKMHKYSADSVSFWHRVLVPFEEILDDNYTSDSHMSDPVVWNGFLYIALETEENATTNRNGDSRSSANRGMNDIFLVKCDLEGENQNITQITRTNFIEEVNPKIVVLKGRMLLVYNEIKYDNNGVVNGVTEKYLYLNERCIRETKAEDLNSHYIDEPKRNLKMPDSPINRDGNEFVQLSDGTAIWIRLMRNSRQLEVITIDG